MRSRDEAKSRGTKLRAVLNDLGHPVGHGTALEAVARMAGYRDWNTCAASLDRKAEILPLPEGWMLTGNRPENFDCGRDSTLICDGIHPLVLRRREAAPETEAGFATIMQAFEADQYRGTKVRFSASLKSEGCDDCVTIWLRADSLTRTGVAFTNLEEFGIGEPGGPVTGTTDWTERSIVLAIPENANEIAMGFLTRGSGAGYAAGFSLETVADDVPVTVKGRQATGPVNLSLSASPDNRTAAA